MSFAAAPPCWKPTSRILRVRSFLLTALAAGGLAVLELQAPGPAAAQSRSHAAYYTLQCAQYGLTVRVPRAWRPIALARGDRAFVLRVPQHRGSPTGYVSCRVSLRTLGLEELARRYREQAAAEQGKFPRLVKLERRRFDPEQVGLEQAESSPGFLATVWEHRTAEGVPYFEKRIELPQGELLFRLALSSDEAHFFAYEPEFDDLVGSLRFGRPRLEVYRDAQGRWRHRRFSFSVPVPAGWRVVSSPDPRQLLLAVAPRRGALRETLAVTASSNRGPSLERLEKELPELFARQDRHARVEVARVNQGKRPAVQIIVHTRRDGVPVVILQRRVPGEHGSYQVTLTCRETTFQKQRRELLQVLDAFRD